MNTKLMLGGFFAVACLGLVGCDTALDSIDPVSSSTETCVPTLSGSQCNGNVVESCASSSGGGWYEVNGSRVCSFTTSGASCAQLVVDNYCSRPAARGETEDDVLVDLLSIQAENLNLQNQLSDLMDAVNQDLVESQSAE